MEEQSTENKGLDSAAAGIVFDTATWIDPEAREGLAWWRIGHGEFSPATEGVMLGEAAP